MSDLEHFELGTHYMTRRKRLVKVTLESSFTMPEFIFYILGNGMPYKILTEKWKTQGFSGGTSGKEPSCQCRRQKTLGFDPWVGKIPWRRTWQPTPILLPGESHGQRSLVGHSP